MDCITFEAMPNIHFAHGARIIYEQDMLHSEYLDREVLIDIYMPDGLEVFEQVSLLLINDGQDLLKMPFLGLLEKMQGKNELEPLVCVAIHCGPERKMEYGTAYSADYLGRGAKAGMYSKFLFDELMPYIRKKYNAASFRDKSIAGFSLGGLSALDIGWNYASEFKKIGIFSASLWWRKKAYEDGYDDEKDRLMHLQIRKGSFHPWLQFYIECGALDETADRNKNGVIDSIDDALDLIVELKAKGYTDQHIRYMEMADGKHDIASWANALPDFLKWGWGKEDI